MKRLILGSMSAIFASLAIAPAVTAQVPQQQTPGLTPQQQQTPGLTPQQQQMPGMMTPQQQPLSPQAPGMMDGTPATARPGAPGYVSERLQPFNLVSMARQGFFRDQGIPSYAALKQAFRTRQITAEDLVEAAVAQNRLAPEVMYDQGYQSLVNQQLRDLRQGVWGN